MKACPYCGCRYCGPRIDELLKAVADADRRLRELEEAVRLLTASSP